MSLSETDAGLFFRSFAVFNAACFSAQLVPVAGALAEVVPSCENRDCSSFTCKLSELRFGIIGGASVLGGTRGGEAAPIPNPGTDIPAWPSLSNALRLRYPSPGCVA